MKCAYMDLRITIIIDIDEFYTVKTIPCDLIHMIIIHKKATIYRDK